MDSPARQNPRAQAPRPLELAILTEGPLREWQVAAIARLKEAMGATLRAIIIDHRARDPTAKLEGYLLRSLDALERMFLPARSSNDEEAATADTEIKWIVASADPPALYVDLVINFGSLVPTEVWATRTTLGALEFRFQGIADEDMIARAVLGRAESISLSTVLYPSQLGPPILVTHRAPAIRDRRFVRRAKADLQNAAASALLESVRVILGARSAATGEPREGASIPVGPVAVGRHIAGAIGDVLKNRIEKQLFHHDYWFLAYRSRIPATSIVDAMVSSTEWTVLQSPADRYYADPCVLTKDDTEHVFFEDYRYALGKAVISWMEYRAGTFSEPRVVLERPWHLSYPFIFEHSGHFYMVPESEAAERIELYRAVEFPLRWERVAVLLDGVRAADTTLHQHDDAWWMFTSIGDQGGGNWDSLHIFFAETPFGPWHPHRENPVKVDVRSARPGGRLFSQDGWTYRPAQNCARSYGAGLVIQKVEFLDHLRYQERPVYHFSPESVFVGNCGLHTLSVGHSLVMIDGRLRRRFRWERLSRRAAVSRAVESEGHGLRWSQRRLSGAMETDPPCCITQR
jgi:hypothetical protein